MTAALLSPPNAGDVCESLRRTALETLGKNQRRLRLSLKFHSRGRTCRLFHAHGPKGTVIERLTCPAGDSVTIAEFDAVEVLDSVMEKLGV